MNDEILARMKAMKLYGMVRAFSGSLATTHMQGGKQLQRHERTE